MDTVLIWSNRLQAGKRMFVSTGKHQGCAVLPSSMRILWSASSLISSLILARMDSGNDLDAAFLRQGRIYPRDVLDAVAN
jgi:hypothetical protein